MREKRLIAAGVAGAAVAAFGASLAGTFQFDDLALLSDPGITSPGGWVDCFRLIQTRPLTWFTFWANYQLAGEHAAVWHAVNLALHVAVALLLWDVLRRLIAPNAAVLATLIFAVHPMLAEPVNYIFARATLLAALFSLLAVRSWIADRAWPAVGWFTAAMLAKEEVAAVPVFLILLNLSRRRALPLAPLGAMFGVALAFGLRVVWATTVVPGAPAGAQAGISPLAYFAVQGVAIWRYLRMLVVPWGFTVDVELARPAPWLAAVAWVGIAAACVAAGRSFRDLRAGFWALGGLVLLLPSSSVFPAQDLAADRRLYLPMLALSAAVALVAIRFDRHVLAGALLALMAISVRYSLVWRTPEGLWSEAKLRAPGKIRPRLQLARALPPEPALRELAEAQRIAPADPAIAAEQGRVLLTAGRPAEALAAFGRALALDPTDARALNNRGTALAALGQMSAARADFERALERDPCLFDARVNLKRLGFGDVEPAGWCRYTPAERAELER
ncbi:MAG TPA: tetratricopeptide repeat protein [Bryobacteraceae bacterium]|nr:tetratricopeptide repeat protein [Bryobacteraceae bacterium]